MYQLIIEILVLEEDATHWTGAKTLYILFQPEDILDNRLGDDELAIVRVINFSVRVIGPVCLVPGDLGTVPLHVPVTVFAVRLDTATSIYGGRDVLEYIPVGVRERLWW